MPTRKTALVTLVADHPNHMGNVPCAAHRIRLPTPLPLRACEGASSSEVIGFFAGTQSGDPAEALHLSDRHSGNTLIVVPGPFPRQSSRESGVETAVLNFDADYRFLHQNQRAPFPSYADKDDSSAGQMIELSLDFQCHAPTKQGDLLMKKQGDPLTNSLFMLKLDPAPVLWGYRFPTLEFWVMRCAGRPQMRMLCVKSGPVHLLQKFSFIPLHPADLRTGALPEQLVNPLITDLEELFGREVGHEEH